MSNRLIIFMIVLSVTALQAVADTFSDNFADSTLRVDYVMTGRADTGEASVSFGTLSRSRRWYGRRHSLARPALVGAADVTVTDRQTGDTLYCESFSTLFQEWLVTGDDSGPRSMPGVALVPYPRRPVDVTVSLRDNRRRTVCRSTLRVDPADILIADRTSRRPVPRLTVYRGNADDSAKIRIGILAEGYTAGEMNEFIIHAHEAADAILAHEPFASMADRFDFVAIETPSAQSGVSVPAQGLWVDTAFGSHFSTFYSDRYLTTDRADAIADALEGTGCTHAIILANTDTYGGGGIYNYYTLTAARNEMFHPVVVHEFGHSFGGLGDEYFYDTTDALDNTYPTDIEPWEPNITTLVEQPCKWQPLIDAGRAGLVEGAGYRSRGLWRGADDCRMRTNKADAFCPVCVEALRRVIKYYTE